MRVCLIVLALLGMMVSTVALGFHYTAAALAPPALAAPAWSSSVVNQSAYSTLAGVPVAAIGLAGFALLGLLAFYREHLLVAVLSLLGLGYALYLTNIEAHVLGTWCVTGVLSLGLSLTLVFVAFADLLQSGEQPEEPLEAERRLEASRTVQRQRGRATH